MPVNGVSAANGRGKRKTKDKVPIPTEIVVDTASDVLGGIAAEGEEEPSVTRCVCGSNGQWSSILSCTIKRLID